MHANIYTKYVDKRREEGRNIDKHKKLYKNHVLICSVIKFVQIHAEKKKMNVFMYLILQHLFGCRKWSCWLQMNSRWTIFRFRYLWVVKLHIQIFSGPFSICKSYIHEHFNILASWISLFLSFFIYLLFIVTLFSTCLDNWLMAVL